MSSATAPKRAPKTAPAAPQRRPRKRTLWNSDPGEVIGGPDLRRLAHLACQLGNYVEAGLSVKDAVRHLSDEYEEESYAIATMLDDIFVRLERGESNATAFARHERRLGSTFTALVAAGDQTGTLDEVFPAIAAILTEEYESKKSIFAEFKELFLILGAALVATLSLLFYAVPVFTTIYEAMAPGAELPWETRAVVAASVFVRSTTGIATLVGSALGIAATIVAVRTIPALRFKWHWLLTKIPKVGKFSMYRNLSRATSTFSRTVGTIGDVHLGLQLAAKVCPNKYIGSAFSRAAEGTLPGRSASECLAETRILPPGVLTAYRTKEQTEGFDSMGHYVKIWDQEAGYARAELVAKIPTLTKILGGSIAGFLMIAMYLPLWDLAAAGDRARKSRTEAVQAATGTASKK